MADPSLIRSRQSSAPIGVILECTKEGEGRKVGWGLGSQAKKFEPLLVLRRRF